MSSAIEDKVTEIENYAALMNDEYGEALTHLYNVFYRREYLNDSFKKAIEKEIERQFKYLKKNCKIVHIEKEYPAVREYNEIVWNDDV